MAVLESLVAAATRVIFRKGSQSLGARNGAQTLAWDLYESVPEVGAYADWISNAMSGATLYAGKRLPDGTVEPAPDNSRAAELVASIAGGPDGQSVLLGDLGSNLAVAGEAWLVIVPDPNAQSFADDRWHILSTNEVKPQRGRIRAMIEGEELDIPEYDPEGQQDPDAPVAIRIWKPSPRWKQQATSPVIRSITILEELRLLNAAVAAVARSRITGRGILLIPAGTRFPGTQNQVGADDSILDTLIEVASTASQEPESAAATVPILLEVPGDLISGVKWLEFSSEFDALAIQLRDEAIRRFGTGADVPAEVLLGMSDSNHWGAWLLTAEGLRMGVEPRLGLVCSALTSEWLRPLLEFEQVPDADEWLVWYDTSGLRSSSNKGASALEAFKLGLVSGAAARRELGFTEADAVGPTDTVSGRFSDTAEGNDLPVDTTQSPPQSDVSASGSLPGALAEALVAAVDGVLWSALTVAGQKIMRTPACPRQNRGSAQELLASAAVHTRHPVRNPDDIEAWNLLGNAWARVPEISQRYGVDDEALTAALQDYATVLLTTGEPHVYDNVFRVLAQSGVLPSTIIGMVQP